MRELPVGCFAVRPKSINRARLALAELQWLKRGVSITPYAHTAYARVQRSSRRAPSLRLLFT